MIPLRDWIPDLRARLHPGRWYGLRRLRGLGISVGLGLLVNPPVMQAEAVKDREGAVRQDRAAREHDPRWVYNDVDRGFAEAKRLGKPVLLVFRCVPCLACAGIDAQVLLEGAEISPLLDQFVCIRVINANSLDLSRFQFDFDLSFSTMFLHSDGTVYGRFGSWTHQKNSQDGTTAGFRRALTAALDIHRGYPANRPSLAGKQPAPTPYRTPLEIPTLQGKYQRELDWNGKVVPSCVHCHQIGEARRLAYREKREPIPLEWMYPMPPPETLGFTLAPDQIATVRSVMPGSVAARAGLQAGDELVSLAGQPLVAVADVSWILHRAPVTGALAGIRRRGTEEQPFHLVLPVDWRQHTDISGRAGTWGLRGMATGGLLLEDAGSELRSRNHLSPEDLALSVQYVGEYGKHAAAKKAGFQKGDIIVAAAGIAGRHTESEFIGRLLQQHAAGEIVPTTVLRGGQRVELGLPIQ